jgi:hypothetical protein
VFLKRAIHANQAGPGLPRIVPRYFCFRLYFKINHALMITEDWSVLHDSVYIAETLVVFNISSV